MGRGVGGWHVALDVLTGQGLPPAICIQFQFLSLLPYLVCVFYGSQDIASSHLERTVTNTTFSVGRQERSGVCGAECGDGRIPILDTCHVCQPGRGYESNTFL
jgi:hypothetical protein